MTKRIQDKAFRARLTIDVYVNVDNYDPNHVRSMAHRQNTSMDKIHSQMAQELVSGVGAALEAGHVPTGVKFGVVKKPSNSAITGLATQRDEKYLGSCETKYGEKAWDKLQALKRSGYRRLKALSRLGHVHPSQWYRG